MSYAKMSKMIIVGLVIFYLVSFGLCASNGDVSEEDILHVRSSRGLDFNSMDPAHHYGGEFPANLAVFSRLVRYEKKDGELKLVPDAAKSYRVSEDGKTIYFELKKGIQFHKGYGEMTAEDVKFSYERIIDPKENSEFKSDFKTLDHVEVTGRYSGKLILNEPMPELFSRTLPFTTGAIISKKAYKELGERFASFPVGSGPYVWEDWEPKQKAVLKRFDGYFGKKPDFKKIVIHPISDVTAAQVQFEAGSLEGTGISTAMVKKYKDKPGVNFYTPTTLRYYWLGFNMRKEPFNDIQVRKAVRYAVNVGEIMQGAFNGVPDRACAMIPEQLNGHWAEAPCYEPDLEKAKGYLKKAGYPNGFKTQLITDPEPGHKEAAALVKEQLARIGIKVKIKVVEDNYPVIGKKSQSGLHIEDFFMNLDPGYWFQWFTCDQIRNWNYWKWCNEEYDQLLDKATSSMKKEKRATYYIEMQKLMDEDVTAVWFTNGATPYITEKGVRAEFLAHYPWYRYFEKVGSE